MDREEAKIQMHEAFEEEYLRGYKQGFKDRSTQSDLEHKTCSSCIYSAAVSNQYTSSNLCCGLGIGDVNEFGSLFCSNDFSCNKFESK